MVGKGLANWGGGPGGQYWVALAFWGLSMEQQEQEEEASLGLLCVAAGARARIHAVHASALLCYSATLSLASRGGWGEGKASTVL